jgi:hypothetical protein
LLARVSREAQYRDPHESKALVRHTNTDKARPSAEEGGPCGLLGGELVERYFFVHFSTFQDGPWLVGLSTSPPIDVL